MTLMFRGLIERVIIYAFIEQPLEYFMGLMAKVKALIDSILFIKSSQITGLPLIAINLLKFHKEANWLIKAYKDRSH